MKRRTISYPEVKFLMVKNDVLNKVLDVTNCDEHLQLAKECMKESKLLYIVRFSSSNDIFYPSGDALLDFECLPVHETWEHVTLETKNHENFSCPSVILEMDRKIPLENIIGKFIGGDKACSKCNQSFNNPSGLKNHFKKCKASNKDIILECRICGKKTYSNFGLTNHMRSLHGVTS